MTEALATPAYYHAGPWTIDEVLELPDNGMRFELVDERLVVSSVPPSTSKSGQTTCRPAGGRSAGASGDFYRSQPTYRC